MSRGAVAIPAAPRSIKVTKKSNIVAIGLDTAGGVVKPVLKRGLADGLAVRWGQEQQASGKSFDFKLPS
jgi:hypothetical protein